MRLSHSIFCGAVLAGAISGFAVSEAGLANALKCNKTQSACAINNPDLTVGDFVGVFNEDDELVATGHVKILRGKNRAIKIRDLNGKIRKNDRIALISTDEGEDLSTSYKIYRRPADMSVGAEGGWTMLHTGATSSGLDVSGFAQWRKWDPIQLVARGVFLRTKGDVSRFDLQGIDTQTLTTTGFGAMPAVSLALRESKPLSFRGEVGLGVSYISADIDGNSSLLQDKEAGFDLELKNGFALLARGSANMLYNFSNYHLAMGLAQTMWHTTRATTLGAGLIVDLK